MTLTSPRFAWHSGLQSHANNQPPMRRGAQGTAVRLFQQGLIDAGFPMPRSTQRHGSVDGSYGGETYTQCRAFQRRESLGVDGVAGRNTLHRLDALLPNNAPPLPPLPAAVAYRVPGEVAVIAQPNTMLCWATVHCMMKGWKEGVSYDIEGAAQAVGPQYGQLVRNNRGLPPASFGPFIRDAGMRVQPMRNLQLADWVSLLRAHGLLWIGQVNSTSATPGLHSHILRGVAGSGDTASMLIIDPAGARQYRENYDRFHYKYEEAIRRTSGTYYQVRHF